MEYTKKDISSKCIQLFLNTITLNDNDIILEPSAGTGSFSDYFKQNNYNINAYDIDPKKDYIQMKNFMQPYGLVQNYL